MTFGDIRRSLSASGERHCQFPPAQTQARVLCNDGASTRLATLAGVGISMSSLWSIYRELSKGSLVRVLPEYEVNDGSAVWLVYPKSNVMTAKVRVMIDFLVEKIGKPPVWE